MIESPERNLYNYGHLINDKEGKNIYSAEKTVSLICGTVKTGQLHSKEGFQGGSVVNNPSASAEGTNTGSIPGLGRSPGVGNGNPLQYSCLENCQNRGAWWATVNGVTKNWT